MSTNSFLIKGWAITLVSALFALSNKDLTPENALLPYFAIPIFWYLNSYFLLQERKYRKLYDEVRIKDENSIDFSMNAKDFNSNDCTLLSTLFSVSIWPIYVFMIIITCFFMFII